MKNILVKISILYLLSTCLISCVRVGIPEYFTEATQFSGDTDSQFPKVIDDNYSSIALIVASPLPPEGMGYPKTLGYQFALSFIPVTRLYQQNSPTSSLIETAASVLQLAGYSPWVVSQNDLPAMANALQPNLIVEMNLIDFAVDAFDLFFLRRNRISGKLSVSFRSHSNVLAGRYKKPLIKDFYDIKYQASGHVPALASLQQFTFSTVLKELLDNYNVTSYQGRLSNIPYKVNLTPSSTSLTFIAPTVIEDIHIRNLGDSVRLSYGINDSSIYSSGSLSRLFSRGMRHGLAKLGKPSATSINRNISRVIAKTGNSFILFSQVTAAAIEKNNLRLQLRIINYQLTAGGKVKQLRAATCTLSTELNKSLDGAAAIAIQVSSDRMIRSFYTDNLLCN